MSMREISIEGIKPKSVLYHYTKSNGVNGIVNHNCFWATKSDFLNDPNEFSYIREIIAEVLDDSIKNKSLANMFINDVMEEEVITSGGNKEYFVLSFSCCRDSITLWSEFGNKTGYNIGLKGEGIIQRIEERNKVDYHGLVVYRKALQKKLIKKLLTVDIPEYQGAALMEILESGKRNKDNPLYKKACKKFQRITAIYAMFFKNEDFSQEKEYRFVFKRDKNQRVHFREKDGFLIPYIEVPLTDEKLPIKEIMVAPQNHIDLAKNGMDYMLKYKGYSVPVELSNIKLRY